MTMNRDLELLKEDLECVHMYLDKKGVKRNDDNGEVFSIVGRIKQLELRLIKDSSEVESYYLSENK